MNLLRVYKSRSPGPLDRTINKKARKSFDLQAFDVFWISYPSG